MLVLPNVLVSGALMGCVYSLLALGLTVIFGVVDIVNFAHGEYLMVGMYVGYLVGTYLADPLIGAIFAAIAGGSLGFISYAVLIRRLLRGPAIAQLFGTFGLMLFLRYGALALFGPANRALSGGILVGRHLFAGGIFLDVAKLAAAVGSVFLFGVVYIFVQKTKVGIALRATAVNKQAAHYMGIDTDKMNALAWAIGGATAGVAGALLSQFFYVSPVAGMVFGVITFATVALGGFGSIPGAFIAGVIVGLVQMLAAQYANPELKLAFIYTLYFVVVSLRPQGLLGRKVS